MKLQRERIKLTEEVMRENLDILVRHCGSVRELAARLDREPSQISQWRNASTNSGTGKPRRISADSARYIEARLGLPVGWMDVAHTQSDEGAPITGSAGVAIHVPLLENAASMGSGEDVLPADVIAGRLPLSPLWVQGRVPGASVHALRFIHGLGDSMSPTFSDGDILLVDTAQRDPAAIDGVYVLHAHGRLFIKRVRQNFHGQLEISSDNPAVKTVDVLDGTHEVEVVGRVLWVWNGRKV